MAKQTIRERLLEGLERSGMSLAEMSRRSGVSYDVLNKLKRGTSQSTSAENAEKIDRVLRQILGQSSAGDTLPPIARVENHEPAPAGLNLVPVYSVEASAGHGALVEVEDEVYSLAFPPDYLRRLTKSPIDNLAIITVKGESMEPTLLDDDIVLLDRSKTNLSYDGLFVLRFDDALHVKRIGRSAKKGHVMVISDNKEHYPPLDMPVADVDPVGRVLWYGRKV